MRADRLTEEQRKVFSDLLGPEHVLVEPSQLQRYERSTLYVERKVRAALRPKTVKEVQGIVALANTYRLPVYPISTGRNWGYGSANPAQDNNVVIDLARMNRILEVDPDLAYAVVEPGVTQGQLADYLREKDIPLWVDCTGASADCSLIGNALERGLGLGRLYDHFRSLCGLEIVLPQGQVLKTGFGQFGAEKLSHVYPWGIGPYLEGLFGQSNFGIVTKAGVWLTPRPEVVELCFFSAHSKDAIGQWIDALRPLLLQGVISTVRLANRLRSLAMAQQYPWKEAEGRLPLPEETLSQLASDKGIGFWNGVVTLYGSKAQVAVAKNRLRQALRPITDRIHFVSEAMIRFCDVFKKPLSVLLQRDMPAFVPVLREVYSLACGTPSRKFQTLAYWRNANVTPSGRTHDPDRDRCGLIWLAPIVPMLSTSVQDLVDWVESICNRHQIEPCIGFANVTDRACGCTLPILYDAQDEEQVRRARACYLELLNKCMENGYIPYRISNHSMQAITSGRDVFWDTVAQIKASLDPNGIISPGRYCRVDQQPSEERLAMTTETFYVGSIPFRSDEGFLEDLFSPLGVVRKVHIIADWDTPTCEPHAYVTLSTDDADGVVERLDGKKFGRLYIRVHKYSPIRREDEYAQRYRSSHC